MVMEKPAAEKVANKSTSLPFSWDTVVQCLNIGNRPLIVSKNKGDVGKIIHEDVIDQKIISNGRLFTQKLITKRIGSSSYLTRDDNFVWSFSKVSFAQFLVN